MAKLPNYNGSIDLISGLRPKNNGTFPLMEAHDVQVTETQRLDDMFANPESWLPIYNGENEGGVQGGSGGSVSAGVPQYNLSTVLKLREEVTLDMTDTMALFSIMSDMNNLLKFQNIGVVVYQEEGEGHQPFIGLDIKFDYVDNALVFSYQGLIYNVDLIVDPVTQVIKGKVITKSQLGGSNVLTVEISQTGASGYLDVDMVGLITEKFPNVNIRQLGKTIYTALEFDATTNTYKFANVNTSDTQAETKLITVNANTNQWTFTQYLTDLGGGGGLEIKQVTLTTVDDCIAFFNNPKQNLLKIIFPAALITATVTFASFDTEYMVIGGEMIASTDTSNETDYLVKVTGTQRVYLTYNYNEQKVGIQIGEDIIDISLLLEEGSTLTLTYME